MFSTSSQVVFLVCCYIITVSAESSTGTIEKVKLEDMLKDQSEGKSEPKHVLHWANSNVSQEVVFDLGDVSRLKLNYSAIKHYDIIHKDNKYFAVETTDKWAPYRISVIVLVVIKVVLYGLYRACYKTGSMFRQRSLLVLVDGEENSSNGQAENNAEQAQTSSENKPPSYEDSVVISPLPTYEELVEKRQTSTN